MAARRRTVMIIIFIMLGVYGTQCMYKYFIYPDLNFTSTQIIKASLPQTNANTRIGKASLSQTNENTRTIMSHLSQTNENTRIVKTPFSQTNENTHTVKSPLSQANKNTRTVKASLSQTNKNTRTVKASLSEMPTCDLPEKLFGVVEKITTPTLTQVTPIFPDIRADKCIESVKWKPIKPFTQVELDKYTECTVKNADPRQVSINTHKGLYRPIRYSFFTFLKKKTDVAIIEVGGYVGVELSDLLPATGAKRYVVIEPVPSFYSKLSQRISGLRSNATVKSYNFGLGKRYENISIGVRGDATAISLDKSSTPTETIQVVNILDFFIQLGVGCRSVDLLTINCEGCEFVVLETLIATNLIEKFDNIQFQPHHAVPKLGNFPCRYCRLRQLLARTHVVGYDYPQVWQAWKRKNSPIRNASLPQTNENTRTVKSSLSLPKENTRNVKSSLSQTNENTRNVNSSLSQTNENTRNVKSSLSQTNENTRNVKSSLSQTNKNTRTVNASLSQMLTCDLPEKLFRVVEKITTPTLTQVTPIFPDIRADKCIESVKWKPIQPFTQVELDQYTECTVKNADPRQVSINTHKSLYRPIRYSFFTFLKKKTNVAIIEVGGYVGVELSDLLPATGAKRYVVIEPVPSFYSKLSQRISGLRSNATVKSYNFGLGKRYENISIGVRGDATAVSLDKSSTPTETIQVVNILDFFIQLGVGCRSVDLLTINCEGCEFVVLETLIATNLIEKFDNIQFQPHHTVPKLGNFPCRYCRLRQLLARTHVVGYDYPQVWQAWKRKNSPIRNASLPQTNENTRTVKSSLSQPNENTRNVKSSLSQNNENTRNVKSSLSQTNENKRTVNASLSQMPTCDLPDKLFRVVEKITTPTLTQVTPIFPDIRADKCIESVKWKPIQSFTQVELDQYTECTVKNADPRQVSINTHKSLYRPIRYSFFTFLKKKTDVAIIEVGGYVGVELSDLLPATGAKRYVVIEPVPSFYSKLSQRISGLRSNATVKSYNFGLGKHYENISIGVRGDATAASLDKSSTPTETIQVVNILDFFIQLGVGCRSVDLLTINCEGCEFVVLETLIATNLIEKFDNIQFQPHHTVPKLGNFPCRYCRLRQLLARTHVVGYDYPQVWQAWKRKDVK